jgi:hypothetical protein
LSVKETRQKGKQLKLDNIQRIQHASIGTSTEGKGIPSRRPKVKISIKVGTTITNIETYFV